MPGNGVKRLGYLNSTIMKVEDIERIFKETVSIIHRDTKTTIRALYWTGLFLAHIKDI